MVKSKVSPQSGCSLEAVEPYQLTLVRISSYWLKYQSRVTSINQYLNQIILNNYQLIQTNYRLRMTKTEYALVWDSIC